MTQEERTSVNHPKDVGGVDTIVVLASGLASGRTQADLARELKLSRQRISVLTKRLVGDGVIKLAIRSNINIYAEDSNYNSLMARQPHLPAGEVSEVDTDVRWRSSAPGPEQARLHREYGIARCIAEPKVASLEKRGDWKVHHRDWGGWAAVLRNDQWTIEWNHGKKRSVVQVWPKQPCFCPATSQGLIDGRKDYQRRCVKGFAWLQRYWGFKLGLPLVGKAPMEIGFRLDDPVIEEWVKRKGPVNIIPAKGDPVILDWSKDEKHVTYWGGGEIETGLERTLTWMAAAESVPALQRQVKALEEAVRPPDDWERVFT